MAVACLTLLALAGCAEPPPPDLAMERFSDAAHDLVGKILDEAAVLHVCRGVPPSVEAINSAITHEIDPASALMIAASRSDAERSRRMSYARRTREITLSLAAALMDPDSQMARIDRQLLMDEGASGAAACWRMEAMARVAVAAATVDVRSLAQMNNTE